MNYDRLIREYIDQETAVLRKMDISQINGAIREIEEAGSRGGTIYLMGNGGSAATASHYANDLSRGWPNQPERRYKCICLTDNIATMTAIANDIGYEEIFRYQLQCRLRKEDLVVGISGSGNSPNVVNAVRFAKEMGVRSLGIVGYDGGEVMRIADTVLHVPVSDMQIAEDLHMMFDHLMIYVFMNHPGNAGQEEQHDDRG